MKVQNLLCEEIKRGLEGLKEIEVGSDEYRKTAEIVVKLTEKAIDLERTEAEIKEYIQKIPVHFYYIWITLI